MRRQARLSGAMTLSCVTLILCVLNWSLGTLILRVVIPVLLFHSCAPASAQRYNVLATGVILAFVRVSELGAAMSSVPWVRICLATHALRAHLAIPPGMAPAHATCKAVNELNVDSLASIHLPASHANRY